MSEEKYMKNTLNTERFEFVSDEDKRFIISFSNELEKMGYVFDKEIGSGYCWGKYMILYRKQDVKSKKVYARLYIKDNEIVLRMYLSNIDQHRAFIENAPDYIREVFTGDYGDCKHCHNEKDGACKFRKSYILDNRLIEKCNGMTFEFYHPTLEKLPGYLELFAEFNTRNRKNIEK